MQEGPLGRGRIPAGSPFPLPWNIPAWLLPDPGASAASPGKSREKSRIPPSPLPAEQEKREGRSWLSLIPPGSRLIPGSGFPGCHPSCSGHPSFPPGSSHGAIPKEPPRPFPSPWNSLPCQALPLPAPVSGSARKIPGTPGTAGEGREKLTRQESSEATKPSWKRLRLKIRRESGMSRGSGSTEELWGACSPRIPRNSRGFPWWKWDLSGEKAQSPLQERDLG